MNNRVPSRMDTFKYTQKFRGRGLPRLLRFAHLTRALIFVPILFVEWKALIGRCPSRTTIATTFVNDVSNATHGRGLEMMNAVICWIRNRSSIEVPPKSDSFSCPSGQVMSRQSINAIVDELRDTGFSQVRNFVDPRMTMQ